MTGTNLGNAATPDTANQKGLFHVKQALLRWLVLVLGTR